MSSNLMKRVKLCNRSSLDLIVLPVRQRSNLPLQEFKWNSEGVKYDEKFTIRSGGEIVHQIYFSPSSGVPILLLSECDSLFPVFVCTALSLTDDAWVVHDSDIEKSKKRLRDVVLAWAKHSANVASDLGYIISSLDSDVPRSWSSLPKEVQKLFSEEDVKEGNSNIGITYAYMQNCAYSLLIAASDYVEKSTNKLVFYLYNAGEVDPRMTVAPRVRSCGNVTLDPSEMHGEFNLNKKNGGLSVYYQLEKTARLVNLTYWQGHFSDSEGGAGINFKSGYFWGKGLSDKHEGTAYPEGAYPVLIGKVSGNIVLGLPFQLSADDKELPGHTELGVLYLFQFIATVFFCWIGWRCINQKEDKDADEVNDRLLNKNKEEMKEINSSLDQPVKPNLEENMNIFDTLIIGADTIDTSMAAGERINSLYSIILRKAEGLSTLTKDNIDTGVKEIIDEYLRDMYSRAGSLYLEKVELYKLKKEQYQDIVNGEGSRQKCKDAYHRLKTILSKTSEDYGSAIRLFSELQSKIEAEVKDLNKEFVESHKQIEKELVDRKQIIDKEIEHLEESVKKVDKIVEHHGDI
ncbi:hypothetical protein JEV30_24860 [Pseudomonas aeruginosa]|nr:hypothetical protein [Pseudomonas aeruginosa]